MSDLVDEKTIARLFEVHPRTVRRWRERGLIQAYATPSGRVRYLAAEVLAGIGAAGVRFCPQMPSYAPSGSNSDRDSFANGGIS